MGGGPGLDLGGRKGVRLTSGVDCSERGFTHGFSFILLKDYDVVYRLFL